MEGRGWDGMQLDADGRRLRSCEGKGMVGFIQQCVFTYIYLSLSLSLSVRLAFASGVGKLLIQNWN